MKRKIMTAAVLAGSMIFSGCSKTEDDPEGIDSSSSKQSEQSSAGSSSTYQSSENSGTSTAVSSDIQSTSSEVSDPETSSAGASEEDPPVETPPVSSTPEVTSSEASSSAPVSEKPPQTNPANRDVVGEGETRTVSGGETLYIESGDMLDVSGSLIVESGAVLNVSGGGELFVKGNVQLDGELVLSKGSKLTMGRDTAVINGSGSIVVKGDFEQIDCECGLIYARITPPERVVENGVTTVGGVVIANKSIKLPPEYGSWLSDGQVTVETYNALLEMNSNSAHRYTIISAYRSYYSQEIIFKGWCDLYGFEYASTISSQAGHSEHQTGLTMDLDSLDESYANTPEGKWLAENCWKYGFIIRYPKGKEDITGYAYEPWHVRYLGKSTANLVYHSGLTLEEFLNVEGGMLVID